MAVAPAGALHHMIAALLVLKSSEEQIASLMIPDTIRILSVPCCEQNVSTS